MGVGAEKRKSISILPADRGCPVFVLRSGEGGKGKKTGKRGRGKKKETCKGENKKGRLPESISPEGTALQTGFLCRPKISQSKEALCGMEIKACGGGRKKKTTQERRFLRLLALSGGPSEKVSKVENVKKSERENWGGSRYRTEQIPVYKLNL